MRWFRFLVCAAGYSALASGAWATPALVDGGAHALRDDLAWLADRGHIGIGLATWPMPRSAIEAALATADARPLSAADADALARVRAALVRLAPGASAGTRINAARHPSAGADGAGRSRVDAWAQMQGHGQGRGHGHGHGHGQDQSGAADTAAPFAWRLRARLQKEPLARDPSPLGIEGSYFAADLGGAVAWLGAIDRWWGPGRHRSLLLGDAAPPVPALVVRRDNERSLAPPWLAALGPVWYELSLGRPAHYQPRGPTTLGMRFGARPMPGIEVGVARYIYWGGEGRPRSFGSLGRALIGDSNVGDRGRDGPDVGNELAGFDVRVSAPDGDATWTGYAQWVGDDEAQSAPSKWLVLAGLQRRHAGQLARYVWTAEASDTRLGRIYNLRGGTAISAYQHSVYVDGHYHQGLPAGASIGGAGVVGSLGLEWMPIASADARRYELRLWSARVALAGADAINAAYGMPGRVNGALLQASGDAPRWRWGLGLSVQSDTAEVRNAVGLLARLELPLLARP